DEDSPVSGRPIQDDGVRSVLEPHIPDADQVKAGTSASQTTNDSRVDIFVTCQAKHALAPSAPGGSAAFLASRCATAASLQSPAEAVRLLPRLPEDTCPPLPGAAGNRRARRIHQPIAALGSR